jgi:hypothetical protein
LSSLNLPIFLPLFSKKAPKLWPGHIPVIEYELARVSGILIFLKHGMSARLIAKDWRGLEKKAGRA